MKNNINTIFTSIFILTIVTEAFLAHLKGKKWYRLGDTVTSLATFYSYRPVTLFFMPAIVLFYNYISSNFGLFKIELSFTPNLKNIMLWLSCVVLTDFCYYWMHRVLHNNRFLWCFHVTHHSSDELNLSVAPRKNWVSKFTYVLFYLPLPFLGFPTMMVLLSEEMVSIYQFFIHTRFTNRIPIYEKLFATPMHHRLHHAVNDEYIDRNYAGIFIIWDRMFGTFIEENAEPKYGILNPPNTYNLFSVCFKPFVLYFKGVRLPRLPRVPYNQYNPIVSLWRKVCAIISLGLSILLSTWFLDHQKDLKISQQIIYLVLAVLIPFIATLFVEGKNQEPALNSGS